MTSCVFFKFKSQKEPTRVEFDGTGLSVFELKREIILKSGLGDGTDFDLAIYSDDSLQQEYVDDTDVITRSTTVIARRLPAMKPGAGRAARYVSGKMPARARNAGRQEQIAKAKANATSNAIAQMNAAVTEEDKLAAMFAAQSEQWNAQQEELSHQAPVYGKSGPKRPVNAPEHEPPVGYICYRCGEKGHWIQACPTNDNPEFDNRPRVKRTTGIPKSFLKTVDKATILAQAADDESKAPSGVMVNADGDFVIAEPDKVAWEKFQAKTQSGAAAQEAAALVDKDLQDRGLECSLDNKMFIDPMKTPCCGKTYCNDCITNALIESDFQCPGCQTEGVLIDDLKVDEETESKLKEYQDEKAKEKDTETQRPQSPAEAKSPATVTGSPKEEVAKAEGTAEQQKSKSSSPQPTTADAGGEANAPSDAKSPVPSTEASATADNGAVVPASKKRPASEEAENPKIPKAPRAMQQAAEQQQRQQKEQEAMMQQMMGGMNGMPGMPMMPFGGPVNMMNMNGGFGMGGMPGMGMPNMNMNMGMMNPMMNMGMMGPMGGNFNNGMGGGGGGGGYNNQGWGGGNMNMNMNMNMGMGFQGNGNGNFNRPNNMGNYNGGNFSQQNQGEDDAYFRKPINPHRHQNRQKRVLRPSDYREL